VHAPNNAISLQLGAILKNIIAADYPKVWPGVADEVKALFASGDVRQVWAGCVASLEMVKAFR
jgi:importin-7